MLEPHGGGRARGERTDPPEENKGQCPWKGQRGSDAAPVAGARALGVGSAGSTHLDDVVGGPVHVQVLDPARQLVGGLTGEEVLADQQLRKLGSFKVLQP